MRRLGAAATLACMSLGWAAADPQLEAATLPDARSVAIGDPATVFATVMNSGDTDATNCFATTSYDDNSPTTLTYQTVDAGNALTGTINTPVTIPAGSQQGFLLAVTASEAFSGTIPFVFECDNASALGRPGINDLVLTVEAGSPPDLVTILATPSADGVLRIATAGGANAAGGAVINIGGGTAEVTARPVLVGPQVNTGLVVEICESNPGTGACLAPRAASVDMSVDGSGNTFSVFLRSDPQYGVPLYPESVRVSVEFRDRTGSDPLPLRGASSIAYTSPANPVNAASPLTGIFAFQMRDEDNDAGGRFLGDGIMAFGETGTGVGYMPTRFGDQVVSVTGNYNVEARSFDGSFEFLQYIVVNFNTATGSLGFNYDHMAGFRGLYVFTPPEDPAGIDAPSSRSVFSDATRIAAISERVTICPPMQDGTFDVYLGEAPTDGQPPDMTLDFDRDESRPESQVGARGDFTGGTGSYQLLGANGSSAPNMFRSEASYDGTGNPGPWSLQNANLRLPDRTEIVIETAYVVSCGQNGFVIAAVSGGVGFTMHFQRQQPVE